MMGACKPWPTTDMTSQNLFFFKGCNSVFCSFVCLCLRAGGFGLR